MAHPSPRLVSRVRDYLLEVSADTGSMEAQGLAEDLKRYAKAPAKKLGPSRAKERAARKVKRRETTAQIRAEVMKRAGGACECCAEPATAFNPLELDHFRGGALKRSRESVAGCWALVRSHHREKTLNQPDAAFWRAKFRMHLRRCHLPIPGDL